MKDAFMELFCLSAASCLFALPMAELTYDNENYLSLQSLREMDGMENVEIVFNRPGQFPLLN